MELYIAFAIAGLIAFGCGVYLITHPERTEWSEVCGHNGPKHFQARSYRSFGLQSMRHKWR